MKGTGRTTLAIALAVIAGALFLPTTAAAGKARLTQSSTQIAPGLTLVKINDPSGPYRIRVLTVDPVSTSVSIDMAAAGPLPSLKTTSAMAQADGAIAAINGDFGAFEGRPLHAFGVDGSLMQTGFQNGASFAVSRNDQHVYIGPSHVSASGQKSLTSAPFTVQRWNQGTAGAGEIAAFTPYGGSQQKSPSGACEIRLKKAGALHWNTNQYGVYRDYRVTAKTCGGSALRFGRRGKLILEARTSGAGSTTLRELKLWHTVRMSWVIGTTGWPGVTEMMGGMPLLVDNGNVIAKSCNSYFCSRNPRTGIGYTAGGKVLLVTVDGRESGSIGMTLIGFAQEMKALGAIEAVNMDGGGSTTMWVKGQGLVNVPCDSSGERAIPNALLVLPASAEREITPLTGIVGPEPPSSSPELSAQLEMSDPGSTGGLMEALSGGAFGYDRTLPRSYRSISQTFEASLAANGTSSTSS